MEVHKLTYCTHIFQLELESQQEKLQNVPVHYHLSLEDIPRKPFTDKNKYCAGCGVELTKSLISTPRYCYYTSNYYCKKCHMNSTSILPAKVVKNWDFRKYSVCTFAKNHIDANFMAPLIDILATNPKLLDWVPALKRILVCALFILLHTQTFSLIIVVLCNRNCVRN